MIQITNNQHYIPQCYIKNWYNEHNKVWGYSTKYNKSNEYGAKQICKSSNLYEGNFKTNLIEHNLRDKSEKLLSDVIKKIINHITLSELEINSLVYHATLLLLRSKLFVENLPDLSGIDKDTYLCGIITLYPNNIVMTKLVEHIGVRKYCYCIELKHKFFVFNDICPVCIRNPNIIGYKENDPDANLYFPIAPNMCILITNENYGNTFYIPTVTSYINYINELFINSRCNYIYSQNKIDDYIQKHLIKRM